MAEKIELEAGEGKVTVSAMGPMRLYHAGNDYPGDVATKKGKPIAGTWIASSYLDGIYTKAEEGFIEGKWNNYFIQDMPQSQWTPVTSGDVFPAEYGLEYVVEEADHDVTIYTSSYSGLDQVVANGVIGDRWNTTLPDEA